jgi:hypothetical protein
LDDRPDQTSAAVDALGSAAASPAVNDEDFIGWAFAIPPDRPKEQTNDQYGQDARGVKGVGNFGEQRNNRGVGKHVQAFLYIEVFTLFPMV